ncbi:MAG: nucleotidyltransferase family protein [Thermoleophilia bacterium]
MGAAGRHPGDALEQRLLDLLADVVADREPHVHEIDDAFAGLLRDRGLTVLAGRMGLRHASFAAIERDLFLRTLCIGEVSGWCVDRLTAAGLRCATLKGPALAAQLFGDDVTRPSTDVDLLVPRRELDLALAVLGAAGMRVAARHAAWYERRWHFHTVLDGAPPHPGLPVELHWSIARPGLTRGAIDGLFDGVVEVKCAGRRLPAPDMEWQLLICAVHAVQHRFAPRPLLDVALIARRLEERQWQAVADRARRLRIGPAVHYATTVSAERLGWSAPAAAEELRPAPWRDAIAHWAISRLPFTGRPSHREWEAIKAVTPLLTTSSPLVLAGSAYLLTDRPRIADALWRRRLRRESRVGS